MAFEELETITKANMPPRANLSYLRSRGRGKSAGKTADDAKPQLIVSIPTTICGTSKSKKFQLALGTGVDKGKLRIKAAKNGGVEPTKFIHAFVFRFRYVPKLGDDIFDVEHRPIKKITDDEFEIDVPPSWFET